MLPTYDFQVVFRTGRVHRNPDPLSRRPCYSQEDAYCEKAENRYGEDLLEVAHPIRQQVGVLEKGGHDSGGIEKLTSRVNVEMDPNRHSDLNEGVGVEKIVNRPEAMMAASSNYRMNVQAADGDMQKTRTTKWYRPDLVLVMSVPR